MSADRTPWGLAASGVREAGIGIGTGRSRIVALYAEPRSWKGRASLVRFGHPRLMNQISAQVPVIRAWHGQLPDATRRGPLGGVPVAVGNRYRR